LSNRKQILIVGAGAIGGLYAAFLARVAEAAGVTLEFDPMYLVKNIRSGEAPLTKHAGSMAQDIANGRETEIDALTGYMVRKGKELGVAMPVTETVYRIAKGVYYASRFRHQEQLVQLVQRQPVQTAASKP